MSHKNTFNGKTIHGFRHTATHRVTPLNLTLHTFTHGVTGARYLHLETPDDNNMFAIGFRTTPEDSTGVAHILEHTVLCGSRRYPVRDPFFSMLRRSLNTFMNALTSSDWTLYPFASRNRSDFYNLMSIYLDAVFFPLLREVDFRQEGHRLEFADPLDPGTPLEIKGVVYNEMKGAMADPSSLLARRLNRAIFPTLTYGFNSGGEPEEIPSLTLEALRAFHARYYHPSNCYFCSYGNLPPEAHLEYIEQNALRHFERLHVASSVPRETRFQTPQRFSEAYPVDPGSPLTQRSLVQVGWLTAPIEKHRDVVALNVLASMLVGNPSAPLYRRLLDSKLGLNLAPGTGYHDDLSESYFAAGLQGAEKERSEDIEKCILTTLSECAEKGFTQAEVDAAIQQLEFTFREVGGDAYPYGLTLLIRSLASWLHRDDPVAPLQTLSVYDELRRNAVKEALFPQLIRRYLLDNPHRIVLTLYPDPELKSQQDTELRGHLEGLRKEMTSHQEQELLSQAEDLLAAQSELGDIDSLPSLDLEEIPQHEPSVDGRRTQLGTTPCWQYAQPTNGIAYLTLRFDLAPLNDELSPYLPLFCTLLPQMGAAGHDYLTIAERIAAYTGGIRAAAQVIENAGHKDTFDTCLEVRGKCLYRHRNELLELLGQLLTAVDFDDLQRMHTVINQLRISLENGIPASGHSYAMRSAAASLSAAGQIKETWNGIEQLRLVRHWADHAPDKLGPLAERLKQVAASLINRETLRVLIVAEEPAQRDLLRDVAQFVSEVLPRATVSTSRTDRPWSPAPSYRGWITSSPVAYVARVFPTVSYTHPDAPTLSVLSRLLRSGYLHREIRERGGAYGGFVSNDPMNGILSMVSYRDPHISRTLKVFHDASAWAASGDFDETDIKEAILSCFSELDRPHSPAGRAYREFNCLEQKLSRETRKAFREGILACRHEALVDVAKRYLLDQWAGSAVAVLSGDDLMRTEEGKISPSLQIDRI